MKKLFIGPLLLSGAMLSGSACTPAHKRPGPGELDDRASCPWLGAPRTRGPFGYGMRGVDPGSYDVGCPPSLFSCRYPLMSAKRFNASTHDPDRYDGQDRMVAISRGFWIGETEVTQRLVSRVTGEPLQTDYAMYPAIFRRLIDAARFANTLSSRRGLQPCYQIDGDSVAWPDGLECEGYRLPTGVEWEIAARAECPAIYAGSNNLRYSAPQHPHDVPPELWDAPLPVKTSYPNGNGLYDMTGNVAEWVWEDRPNGRPPDPVDDGVVPTLGDVHILRGGVREGVPVNGGFGVDAVENDVESDDTEPKSNIVAYGLPSESWFGVRLARTRRD